MNKYIFIGKISEQESAGHKIRSYMSFFAPIFLVLAMVAFLPAYINQANARGGGSPDLTWAVAGSFKIYQSASLTWGSGSLVCSGNLTDTDASVTNCISGTITSGVTYRVEFITKNIGTKSALDRGGLFDNINVLSWAGSGASVNPVCTINDFNNDDGNITCSAALADRDLDSFADDVGITINGSGSNRMVIDNAGTNATEGLAYLITTGTSTATDATGYLKENFTGEISSKIGITAAPPTYNITGKIFSDEGSTPIISQPSVYLSVDGGTAAKASASADGSYSINTSSAPSNGSVITIWINDYNGSQPKASHVFSYGETACPGHACSNHDLYQNHVVLDTKNSSPMTNLSLSFCNNTTGGGCSDSDIGFTYSSGNITLTYPVNELYVSKNFTFAPGGNVTAQKLDVEGTYSGASETLTLSGSGTSTNCTDSSQMPLCIVSGSVFIAPVTVNYTGTSNTTVASSVPYHNLVFTPSSGTPTYTAYTPSGPTENWIISRDDSTENTFSSMMYDSVNGVMYAGSGSTNGTIFRCSTSTLCDEQSDWTTSFNNPGGGTVETMIFDSIHDVIYAGTKTNTGVNGSIYRCDNATNGNDKCQNPSDWTMAINTGEFSLYSLEFDSSNGVLYASTGSIGGYIYRCNTISTSCASSSNWTIVHNSVSGDIYSLAIDQGNHYLYASAYISGQGKFYRCDIAATNCDSDSDWSAPYNVIGLAYDLEVDQTNHVIYRASNYNGVLYRCDITATDCDANSDWTTSLDSTDNVIKSLVIDQADHLIYAGSDPLDGIIYRCDISATACDDNSDWSVSYDTPESYIYSLGLDTTNKVLYAGTYSNGLIYRGAIAVNPYLTVNNDLVINTNATFVTTSGALYIAGNFTNSGTFTHNSGTVIFTGSGTHTIGGTSSTHFYSFTDTTAGSSLIFANDGGGSTPLYTFDTGGTVTITGTSGSHITITSDNQPTNSWLVHFDDAQSAITHVSVTYSDCDGTSATVTLDADSSGSNNGSCWVIPGLSLTQNNYQWFYNANNVQPGSQRASSNNTADALTTEIVRLRLNISVSGAGLNASSKAVRLKYSTSVGGTYTDIGSTVSFDTWRYYDNPSATHGATLSSSLLSSNVLETYQEANSYPTNPNSATAGQTIEYDFSLDPSRAVPGQTYYFRVYLSDNSALNGYTNTPSIYIVTYVPPGAGPGESFSVGGGAGGGTPQSGGGQGGGGGSSGGGSGGGNPENGGGGGGGGGGSPVIFYWVLFR